MVILRRLETIPMPKRSKNSRPVTLKNFVRKDNAVCPFRWVQGLTIANGTTNGNVRIRCDVLGSHVADMADAWMLFRMRALRFRLLPYNLTTSPGSYNEAAALGWITSIPDTLPADFASVATVPNGTCVTGSQTIPSNWVTVSKDDLAGPFPWYKTIPGTADPTEEEPGFIAVGLAVAPTTTSLTMYIELDGIIEFKGGVSVSQTPAYDAALIRKVHEDRVERARLAERARMLNILAPPEPVTPVNSRQADALKFLQKL